MHRWTRIAAITLAALLTALPPAQAHDESEAPQLRDDVERVWHEPEVPEPGTQWSGGILFTEGHNVTEVAYQICRTVRAACFAPPTPAQEETATAWSFNTTDYRANDRTIAWGVDDGEPWRVGVKYILVHDDGSKQSFPPGLDFDSQECVDLGFVACNESHYFVFDMPGAKPPGNDAPLPGLLPLVAVVTMALLGRRLPERER